MFDGLLSELCVSRVRAVVFFLVRTVLQEAHECVMQALVISRMMLGEVHPLLAEAYKCVVTMPHTHASVLS